MDTKVLRDYTTNEKRCNECALVALFVYFGCDDRLRRTESVLVSVIRTDNSVVRRWLKVVSVYALTFVERACLDNLKIMGYLLQDQEGVDRLTEGLTPALAAQVQAAVDFSREQVDKKSSEMDGWSWRQLMLMEPIRNRSYEE
jgi:hypothetical protein